MAANVSTRLTRRDGRRFALTVGGAFVVFAVLAWWRGHLLAVNVLGALAGALVVAGLLVPSHLGPIERAWMKIAHAISLVMTPVVMAAIYFGIITPIGLVRRWLGYSSIEHRPSTTGFWKVRSPGKRRSASMEQQF
jgi:hypothetical protein